MTEQLEIDFVPYDLTRVTENEISLQSEYYANKLRIKSRFTEKYAGYYCGEAFINLDIDENTLTFICRSQPVTADMVATFFENNISTIDEIGYECLYPEPI